MSALHRLPVLLAIAALGSCGGGSESPLAQPAFQTNVVPRFDRIGGERIGGAGPTVVVLATNINDTLNDDLVNQGVVPRLVTAGYQVLTLDLPCHGADAASSTVDPLYCWSVRIHDGDNAIFSRFCAELGNVLTSLGLNEVGIVGISRGGYMAITCAAYEPRITAVALIMPVTDLDVLSEFQQYPASESLFGVQQYVPVLSHLPVLVRIGKSDERVRTDLAVAFAQQVHAQLQLLDTSGHSAPEDGSTIRFLETYLPP